MYQILIDSFRETLFMVLTASLFTILIGIPVGMLMACIANSQNRVINAIYLTVYAATTSIKAIPYLLLMLLFIPTTNWLINHKVSYTTATLLPLATAGSFMLAQQVFIIVKDLLVQWQSTSKVMGATKQQTLFLIVLPEGLGPIIQASATSCSYLVGFSAIAGSLGAGGLGQLAIEKSIQESSLSYVLISIALLVALQQLIHYTGSLVAQQTQTR